MKKTNIPRYKTPRKRKKRIPGESPGIFVVSETALFSKIHVYVYDSENIVTKEFSDIHNAYSFIAQNPGKFYWIDIQGLGTQDVLNSVKEKFGINALVMEDMVNTHQRPKFEEFDDYIFVVTRVLDLDENLILKNEQLSMILNQNTLV